MQCAGDNFYARGGIDDDNVENSYGIYRRGKVYTDPKTKEVLGVEAVEVGQARSVKLHDGILELQVDRSNQQIMAGDLLLATEDRDLVDKYYTKVTEKTVRGSIMTEIEGVS